MLKSCRATLISRSEGDRALLRLIVFISWSIDDRVSGFSAFRFINLETSMLFYLEMILLEKEQ